MVMYVHLKFPRTPVLRTGTIKIIACCISITSRIYFCDIDLALALNKFKTWVYFLNFKLNNLGLPV